MEVSANNENRHGLLLITRQAHLARCRNFLQAAGDNFQAATSSNQLHQLLTTDIHWELALIIGDTNEFTSENVSLSLRTSGRAAILCELSPRELDDSRSLRILATLAFAFPAEGSPHESGTHRITLPYQVTIPPGAALMLDSRRKVLWDIDMSPLSTGEFRLLEFLGKHPQIWHSTRELCSRVYQRKDLAGRQLVWKYASTLRKKLEAGSGALLEVCRRRGYRCIVEIQLRNSVGG